LFLLLVAGALVIWLAFLLSAALTMVGSEFPTFAVSSADAATTLNCGTPSCGTGATQDFSYTPPANSWAVVASRSTTASGDPRVCLYADAAYTQQRACSNASAVPGVVEFTVMDFHRSAAVTNYARMDRLSGSGEVCTQLDCGATLLLPDAAPLNTSWNLGNVVRVFNVPVTAGTTYRADLVVTGGTSNFGLAAFRSNQQANYAAGRSQAVALADRRGNGQGEGIYFEATANDTVGLVLWVNNAATTATFRIKVRTATRLIANVAQTYVGTNQKDFFTVPEDPRGWAVLALRPAQGFQFGPDADLRLFDSPDYLTLLGTSSAEAGIVDFIVANYANAPQDTGAALMISLGPLGSYTMDYFEHPPLLTSGNNAHIDLGGRVGAGVAMNLTANVEYQVLYDPDDGTNGDAALSLYGPRGAKPNFTYGTRADSLQGSDVWGESAGGWPAGDGYETFYFTPTITGQYFVYAYQKRSSRAAGVVRYFPTSLVGVPAGPAPGARVALASPWPSPARGGTVHLRCDLAEAARADLEILDVRGRSVRRAFTGLMAAGATVLTWDGRTESGLLAAPGLYFARLVTPVGRATQVVVWLR
jgi:hypothetical protein